MRLDSAALCHARWTMAGLVLVAQLYWPLLLGSMAATVGQHAPGGGPPLVVTAASGFNERGQGLATLE